MKDMIIPSEINNICLYFFFYSMDKFCAELSGVDFEISQDGYHVIYNRRPSKGVQSIFGEEEIESLDNDIIYIWTFEVIQSTKFFPVGLSSAYIEHLDKCKQTWFGQYQNSYYYNGYNGGLTRNQQPDGRDECNQWEYGPKLHAKDIIEMTFDAGKGCLTYRVNGAYMAVKSKYNSSDDVNVAFSNIVKGKDVKYRMAVALLALKDSIKINSFEMKQ